MTATRWLLGLGLAALAAAGWAADPAVPTDLGPEVYVPYKDLAGIVNPLDKSVLLNRTEFDALLKAARGAAVPAAAVGQVTRADYTGAVQGDRLTLAAALQVTALGAGLTPVELKFADVGVTDVLLDGAPAPLNYDDRGRLLLLVSGAAPHRLTFTASALLKELAGGGLQFSISLPPAVAGTLKLELPGDQEAHANVPVMATRYDRARDTTAVELAVGGQGVLAVALLGNGRQEDQQPILLGEAATTIGLTPTAQTLNCVYTVQVLRRSVRELTFTLPTAWTVTDVACPNLTQWAIAARGDTSELTVRLQAASRGVQVLQFSAHGPAPAAAWVSPAVSLVGAAYQRGYLLVEPGAQLAPRAERLASATRQDVAAAAQIAGLTGTAGRLYFLWGSQPKVELDLAPVGLRRDCVEKQTLAVTPAGLVLTGDFQVSAVADELFNFEVELPPAAWDLSRVAVDGQDQGFEYQVADLEGGRRLLHLELARPVRREGAAAIQLVLRQTPADWQWTAGTPAGATAPAAPRAVQLPLLRSRTDKATGQVSVTAAGDLEVVITAAPPACRPVNPGKMTALGLGADALAAYRYDTAPGGELTARVSRQRPRLDASVIGLASVTPTGIVGEFRFAYTVSRAGTATLYVLADKLLGQQLNLTVPGHRVTAKAIVNPRPDTVAVPAPLAERYHLWQLKLDRDVRGAAPVVAQYSLPLNDLRRWPAAGGQAAPADLRDVPLLRPAGADQVSELLAVQADEELEVVLRATDAREVDTMELPPLPAARRILGAYRLKGEAAAIGFSTTAHEKYDLPLALAVSARLKTLIGADGSQQTEAVFALANAGLQFVTFRLPPGAQLWSARVGGEQAKPTQDASGDYSLAVPYTRQPLELAVVYAVPATGGSRRELALAPPVLPGLTVNQLEWQVIPPPHQRIVDHKSDLTPSGLPVTLPALWRVFDMLRGVGQGSDRLFSHLSRFDAVPLWGLRSPRPPPAAPGTVSITIEQELLKEARTPKAEEKEKTARGGAGAKDNDWMNKSFVDGHVEGVAPAAGGKGESTAAQEAERMAQIEWKLIDPVLPRDGGKEGGAVYADKRAQGIPVEQEVARRAAMAGLTEAIANGEQSLARGQYADAVNGLTQAEIQLKQTSKATPAVSRDLARVQLQLGKAYLGLAKEGVALDQYQRAREALGHALDADPSLRPQVAALLDTAKMAQTKMQQQISELPRTYDTFRVEGRYTLPVALNAGVAAGPAVTFRGLGTGGLTVKMRDAAQDWPKWWLGFLVAVALGWRARRGTASRKSALVLTLATAATLLAIWVQPLTVWVNGAFNGALAIGALYLLHGLGGWFGDWRRRRRAATATPPAASKVSGTATTVVLALTLALGGLTGTPSARAGGKDANPPPPPVPPRTVLPPIIPYGSEPSLALRADKILIPYGLFVVLWNATHPERQLAPPAPGTDLSIAGATYEATLTGERLELVLRARVTTRGSGWVTLPLPLAGVAVSGVTLDGRAVPLQAGPAGTLLLLEGGQGGLLELKAVTTPQFAGRKGSVTLALPLLPLAVLKLRLPDPDLEVEADPCPGVPTRQATSHLAEWTIPIGDARQLTLQWRPRAGTDAADRTVAAALTHEVHAFHWALLGVTRAVYSFSGGQNDRFELLLPAAATLTALTGANLRDHRVAGQVTRDGQAYQVIEVRLHRPAAKQYELTCRWAAPLPALDTPAELLLPQAGGVGGEQGTVKLFAAGGVGLKVVTAAGGRRLEERKAAPVALADQTAPVASYGWAARPFALVAQVSRELTEASVRLDQLVRVSADASELLAQVRFAAKRGRLYGADFKLPAGYELLSVTGSDVEGWHLPGPAGGRLHVDFRTAVAGTRLALVLVNDQAPAAQFAAPLLTATDPDGKVIPDQAGRLAVQVAPALEAQTRASTELTAVPPNRCADWLEAEQLAAVQFAYAYEKPGIGLDLGVRQQPTTIRVEIFAGVAVQETAARYTYRLRYTIAGSPVDQLRFTLPATYAPLVAVESKALRAVRQEPAADGRQRWVVTLCDETTGVLDIAVNFAVPLEANTTALDIPRLSTDAPAGYRAILGVQNLSRHELTLAPSAGWQPVTVDEQRVLLGDTDLARALQYAYQTFADDWSAALKLKLAPPATRLQAVIDLMTIVTAVDKSGELRYEVRLALHNRTEQFLQLQLPAGLRLWSAFVADAPVKPVVPPNAQPGAVLVPLVRSSAGALPCDVRLMLAGASGQRVTGLTRLRPPQLRVLNIPVKQTAWSLLLPEEFRYLRPAGNMSPIAGTAEITSLAIDARLSQFQRLVRSAQEKQASPLAAQQLRDELSSLLSGNEQAIQERRGQLKDAEYERLQGQWQSQALNIKTVAGNLEKVVTEQERAGQQDLNRLLNASAANPGQAERERNKAWNYTPEFVAKAGTEQLYNLRSELKNLEVAQKAREQNRKMQPNQPLVAKGQAKQAAPPRQAAQLLNEDEDRDAKLNEVAANLGEEQTRRLNARQEELQKQVQALDQGRLQRYYQNRTGTADPQTTGSPSVAWSRARHAYEDVILNNPADQEAQEALMRLYADLRAAAKRRRQTQEAANEWAWMTPAQPAAEADGRTAGQSGLSAKLQTIIISKISFEDTPVTTVFEFLKTRSRELDPQGIGVNFLSVLRPAGAPAKDWQEPTITMDFDNIPLGEAVRYVCEGSGLRYRVEDRAVVILGTGVTVDDLELGYFPADLRLLGMDADKAGPGECQQCFEEKGVTFPTAPDGQKATISFDRATSQFIVRNTPDNLDLIARILAPHGLGPGPTATRRGGTPRTPPPVPPDPLMERKLRNIKLAKIAFEDTPVTTVFEFLKNRSRELDPEGIGVNFFSMLRPNKVSGAATPNAQVTGPAQGQADAAPAGNLAAKPAARATDGWQEPTITMDFDNISLGDAIRYICEGSGLRYKIEGRTVVILGMDVSRSDLELRLIPVDPRRLPSGGDDELRTYLEAQGVTFPAAPNGEAATIAYDRRTKQLIARNTPDNLNLIERVFAMLASATAGGLASQWGGGGGWAASQGGKGVFSLPVTLPEGGVRLDFAYPGGDDAWVSVLAVPLRWLAVLRQTAQVGGGLLVILAVAWLIRRRCCRRRTA